MLQACGQKAASGRDAMRAHDVAAAAKLTSPATALAKHGSMHPGAGKTGVWKSSIAMTLSKELRRSACIAGKAPRILTITRGVLATPQSGLAPETHPRQK